MNKKTIELEAENIKLARQCMELKSQLVHQYHFAQQAIDKASVERMVGSGVILTLTALGGKELVEPVMIKDGLSPETIVAIKRDLYRSYDLAIAWRPYPVDAEVVEDTFTEVAGLQGSVGSADAADDSDKRLIELINSARNLEKNPKSITEMKILAANNIYITIQERNMLIACYTHKQAVSLGNIRSILAKLERSAKVRKLWRT